MEGQTVGLGVLVLVMEMYLGFRGGWPAKTSRIGLIFEVGLAA